MPTVEEMLSRARELEKTASNPNIEPSRRNAMQTERLNLIRLILKDPQRGAEKQAERIAASEKWTTKANDLMNAMADAESAWAVIPSGDQARKNAAMDRILDLRMQIQKHAEIKAEV